MRGAPSQMGGGTYPRATLLNDGSLLGAYTGFGGGNNVLTVVKSTNRGTTWSEIGTVATEPSDANDLDNPYPLQLPSGRLLIAFRNHDKVPGSNPAQYTYYRIVISYSDNGGASWAYLSTPAQDPTIGLWEPFMRVAQDGTLQLYYSRLLNGADQDSMMLTSSNGGATWSAEQTISGAGLVSRDGMLGVAAVSGSNLIAVFECEQNGLFAVDSVTSSDGGRTWGNHANVYTPTGNNKNAGAPQVINVGGTLVVSFMTDESTGGTASNWPGSSEAKVITSGDGGRTWGNKVTVGPDASYWPGLVGVDGSNFLYLYQGNGALAQPVSLS